MKDRKLVEDAGGWGLSVTRIQNMPVPEPRHVEETTAAITGKDSGGAGRTTQEAA
jgi:dihydroorotase